MIWALGWAMIFLGVIIALPIWFIAIIGGALIVGHNAFDGLRPTNALLAILHGPGFVVQREGFTVFASYPLIPWIGVTAVGYALAGIFAWEPERRRSWLLNAGLAAIAAFIVIRTLNIYGDPAPWKAQATTLRTMASFINTTKYPPSLLYVLMTLGRGAHFFLIHAAAAVTCLVRYGTWNWMFESPNLGAYPFTRPPDWGYSLPVVYAVWIAVVVSLYPACKWMARVKAGRRHSWLSYL